MKIVIIGASGMLGHVMLAVLAKEPNLNVVGTIRSASSVARLAPHLRARCRVHLDVNSQDDLCQMFVNERPDVVVNCVGLVKQLQEANDPLAALPINTMLPHRLSKLCSLVGARLVHVSTDCVFSGSQGNYKEDDVSDAFDLYGRSKYLGEVSAENEITLRTSIIGHELSGRKALVEWFLGQNAPVSGFARAIFSGLPTVELARVVRDYVLPSQELFGVYHVGSQPISKYDLLKLISQQYKKNILIERDCDLILDRSLNSKRFAEATGYVAPLWPELVSDMFSFYKGNAYV